MRSYIGIIVNGIIVLHIPLFSQEQKPSIILHQVLWPYILNLLRLYWQYGEGFLIYKMQYLIFNRNNVIGFMCIRQTKNEGTKYPILECYIFQISRPISVLYFANMCVVFNDCVFIMR